MWMMTVWRPLVVLFGVGGLGSAATVTSVIWADQPARNAIMLWVFLVMAFQAAISAGLILFGLWAPLRRWLGGATHAP
jgi:hypothetical protein